jgi:hypothetical protein
MSFSFENSNSQRSNPNNIVSNNNIPTLSIQTQNNYTNNLQPSTSSEIADLKSRIDIINLKLEEICSNIIPNTITQLLDSKVERLFIEQKINESYLLQNEKSTKQRKIYDKEAIISIVKVRGDALLGDSQIASLFPSLSTLR